jgi:hypothetical protein
LRNSRAGSNPAVVVDMRGVMVTWLPSKELPRVQFPTCVKIRIIIYNFYFFTKKLFLMHISVDNKR